METILLLNVSYEPLAVIPLRRAMSLLLRDKVDPVTHDTVSVSSPANTLKIPAIIRLKRYIHVPQRGVRWSRQAVLQRDVYQCIYCGIKVGEWQRGQVLTKRSFTIDHLIPRSRGGQNTWGNTACSCQVCNIKKGPRMPHEAGMTLRWEPKTPRVNYLVVSSDIPATWKIYLEV
jgi:5-methylcytosine-specific restriction endonuclease McrA